MTTVALFGGIGELLPVIITVIVIVLSLLNQLFRGQQKEVPAPRPVNRPPRPQGPQRQADDLVAEIDEFLKRAQQRPARGEADPLRTEAVIVVEPAPQQRRPPRERKPSKPAKQQRPRPRDSAPPIAAEVVRAETVIAPSIPPSPPLPLDGAAMAASPGAGSSLKPTEAAFAGPSETQGRDDPGALGQTALVHLLTHPESIREAIIISEILRRPEERWS